MRRSQKEQRVLEYEQIVAEADYAILTEHAKIPVPEVERIRREFAALGCQALVMKNTLARIVFERQGMEEITEYLLGPSMLFYGKEDIAPAAKLLQRFSRQYSGLVVKAVLFDGQVHPRESFRDFTMLPSKQELRGMFVSVIHAPAARFVRVLAAAQRFVTVLDRYAGKRAEQGDGGG